MTTLLVLRLVRYIHVRRSARPAVQPDSHLFAQHFRVLNIAKAQAMINSLQPPDTFHLQAAQGWLELGNYIEADEELEKITPQFRTHPDVEEVRWHLCAQAKRWEACVNITDATIKLDPKRSEAWIHRSFALHELRRTQDAFDQLLTAAEQFPTVWTIPYNLACYCAQLGRMNESKLWLERAILINERMVRQAAIDDPDLKPLWDSMSGTFWQRED
jgi:tetratricopeptide (TPR) repeat protein